MYTLPSAWLTLAFWRLGSITLMICLFSHTLPPIIRCLLSSRCDCSARTSIVANYDYCAFFCIECASRIDPKRPSPNVQNGHWICAAKFNLSYLCVYSRRSNSLAWARLCLKPCGTGLAAPRPFLLLFENCS